MSNGAIPVLLYHSVESSPGPASPWGAVSRRALHEHLQTVLESGRTPLTMTQLGAALRGEQRLPERAVAVTFDDGYADTLDTVHDLLEQGIGATVYVTSGAIGAPGRISAAEVAALAQLPGVEVGAHGVHHFRLDELSATPLHRELRASRAQLEALTGCPVESFAYPHGAYDRTVRAGVLAAGYRSAAAVKNALSHPADDPFAVARWTVTNRTRPEQLRALLRGRGAPLSRRRERLRTRAYREFRRRRRRVLERNQAC